VGTWTCAWRAARVRASYNSCRNRHCPKCQAVRQAQWVDGREQRILPTHHFHVVFTLPAPLRPIALRNRRRVFNMLLACAAETLLELGRDPKRLAAQLAVTAVLHTWKRDLGWHPHVHGIVSGGGLDIGGEKWTASPKRFLFPVLVMGELFRGKMIAALGAAIDRGNIDLGGADRTALFDALWRTRWVVYAKRPFGGAEHVIRYLGQFRLRVSSIMLTNSRS
jgi:Putative transposase/Transposase zinc-binding domain